MVCALYGISGFGLYWRGGNIVYCKGVITGPASAMWVSAIIAYLTAKHITGRLTIELQAWLLSGASGTRRTGAFTWRCSGLLKGIENTGDNGFCAFACHRCQTEL